MRCAPTSLAHPPGTNHAPPRLTEPRPNLLSPSPRPRASPFPRVRVCRARTSTARALPHASRAHVWPRHHPATALLPGQEPSPRLQLTQPNSRRPPPLHQRHVIRGCGQHDVDPTWAHACRPSGTQAPPVPHAIPRASFGPTPAADSQQPAPLGGTSPPRIAALPHTASAPRSTLTLHFPPVAHAA